MADHHPDRDEALRAHIDSVSRRSDVEHARLTSTLVGRTWPGGQQDRREPAAVAWLTRWRTRGATPLIPACSCAVGPCELCN